MQEFVNGSMVDLILYSIRILTAVKMVRFWQFSMMIIVKRRNLDYYMNKDKYQRQNKTLTFAAQAEVLLSDE